MDGLLDADEKHFKEHGEPLFSSHMIDLSEEEVDYNIKTTAEYLKRAAPMKQWLEMVEDPFTLALRLTDWVIGNRYYRW